MMSTFSLYTYFECILCSKLILISYNRLKGFEALKAIVLSVPEPNSQQISRIHINTTLFASIILVIKKSRLFEPHMHTYSHTLCAAVHTMPSDISPFTHRRQIFYDRCGHWPNDPDINSIISLPLRLTTDASMICSSTL